MTTVADPASALAGQVTGAGSRWARACARIWARIWAVVDARPAGRRVPGSVWVFAVGIVVGTAASYYSVHSGRNLDYGDSMAHLTIARRIVDSKSPGLQQLGTVWLPLPHLLLLPLTLNLWLWHTGISACILGTLCLGATATGLWRVMARVGIDGIGRLVGLGILLANVSFLYACTTALTEPVLIASLVCSTAGLAGWAFSPRRLSGGELAVFAGIPAAAAVLSRYEGWAFVVSGTVFVGIVSLRRRDGLRRAFWNCFSFGIVPAIGIAWWLAYNTSWYRDPLEFLDGPYSAAAFTQTFIQQGLLTTKGNAGLSLQVYGEAVLQTAGLVPIVLAGLGLAVLTARRGLDDRALLIWLGGTSSAFLVFSLTTGQHIMVNRASLPPGTDYNNRYALSAVPWIALLVAYLVGEWRGWVRARVLAAALVAALMAAQVTWWLQDPYDRLTVITEGDNGHTAFRGVKAAAGWLREHYRGGDILMDESSDKLAISPVLGIPMTQIYNRASGDYFDKALADPAGHVEWVLMHVHQLKYTSTKSAIDNVTKVLAHDPQFHLDYRLAHRVGNIGIYQRVAGAAP